MKKLLVITRCIFTYFILNCMLSTFVLASENTEYHFSGYDINNKTKVNCTLEKHKDYDLYLGTIYINDYIKDNVVGNQIDSNLYRVVGRDNVYELRLESISQ